MEKNPVKICDTTLRDGHQSSLATRMRMEDMELLAEDMGKAGFYSMEVWGGATFDVATRFLNEDPWERPRILKRLMPDTKLQMLLRAARQQHQRQLAMAPAQKLVENRAHLAVDLLLHISVAAIGPRCGIAEDAVGRQPGGEDQLQRHGLGNAADGRARSRQLVASRIRRAQRLERAHTAPSARSAAMSAAE